MRGFQRKRAWTLGFLVVSLAVTPGVVAETAVKKMVVLSRRPAVGQNTLVEILLPEWKPQRSASVIPSNAAKLSRDPLGRLWVGLTQNARGNDNRVQLFSADLRPLRTLTTRDNPEAGIRFSGNRAYVACAQNGFGGAVDVFDLDTLSPVKTVPIPAPSSGKPHLLTSLAVTDRKIVTAGMTSGPDPGKRYGLVTVLDPVSLDVAWQSGPMEGLDVWTILPYGDTFLLLNAAGGDPGGGNAGDVLVLEPDNGLEPLRAAPSPVWGAIAKDVLYLFHNQTWNSVSSLSRRTLSSYSLTDKTVTRWPLPDNWEAGGIDLVNGRILLVGGPSNDPARQGVYEYDPVRRELLLRAQVPGADQSVPGE